jgi:nitrate/nitrite transporter NarK
VAALCAALLLDNFAPARNERRAMREAWRSARTWLTSLLHVGTFGSFIGFSFAFGQVLADRLGRAWATLVNLAVMAAAAAVDRVVVERDDRPVRSGGRRVYGRRIRQRGRGEFAWA